MKTLVLGFFKESMDPSVVTFHVAQGAEMTEGGSDTSWDSGDGLEEDDPVEPDLLVVLEDGEA